MALVVQGTYLAYYLPSLLHQITECLFFKFLTGRPGNSTIISRACTNGSLYSRLRQSPAQKFRGNYIDTP